MNFSGVFTALVTPFYAGELDVDSFASLIERQISAGVDGIVPVGTTGESPTLTHAEHREVIRLAVEIAAGRCAVLAGTGSNSTTEAIELTREAEALGADGALLVAPYYNRPSQEGLRLHFLSIAQNTRLPLALYNIPGRCGVEIAVATVARLAEEAVNIVCIKEAGGSVERVSALRESLGGDFSILSGDDSLTLPFLSVGACGVISVASNVTPGEIVALHRFWRDGKAADAAGMHHRLYPLFKDLFIETNPVPVKEALSAMGAIRSGEVRLPLSALSSASREKLFATLGNLGLA